MRSMVNYKLDTVADHIRFLGHDEDFAPKTTGLPTVCQPGSAERVEVYRLRMIHGEPIFHPLDKNDCEGVIGGPMRHNEGRIQHTKVSVSFVNAGRVVRKPL